MVTILRKEACDYKLDNGHPIPVSVLAKRGADLN